MFQNQTNEVLRGKVLFQLQFHTQTLHEKIPRVQQNKETCNG